MNRSSLPVLLLAALSAFAPAAGAGPDVIVERDAAVVMRDGVVLRADIYRPAGDAPLPVLVYRTPYGKHNAASDYRTHLSAVERGYAVVLQDVRGRYASEGLFEPYRQEGADGRDTIEWAAAQAWSNGRVGTWGLSYPGAVQWLAAMESPPHLKAMAPAMTFSSPRNFFYMNGIFDRSWLPWIFMNIAPDARARLGIAGPVSDADVAEAWRRDGAEILAFRPLADLPWLRKEAPYYFEWLRHPPEDAWWDWAEIRGRYRATDAAVLNLSGWYDEAYGPEGAVTNHNGVVASRAPGAARSRLIIGPWQHGVHQTARRRLGVMDFGADAGIDYDSVLLDFFDTYLKPAVPSRDAAPAVRYFLMGANAWRNAEAWPPAGVEPRLLCLSSADGKGLLTPCDGQTVGSSSFVSDPANPVTDRYGTMEAHDFQELAARPDVIVFETPALQEALTIAGSAVATLYVSCNCRDFDLWTRLLDVHPDGRAVNLMSPGGDVRRASYRHDGSGRRLLEPGEVYEIRVGGLLTANRFAQGHRVRLQVSAAFDPHLSINLQTGLSEALSSESAKAIITVHYGPQARSTLQLPVLQE